MIFWILVICNILTSIYLGFTYFMYHQISLLYPDPNPDIAERWLDIWFLEMTNASVLLVGFISVTIIIGIYLRVVPPSLDDYARELAEDEKEC